MVADDVQDHVEPLLLHGLGEAGEVQAFAGQVFVQFVEVGPPVTVETGLALVLEERIRSDR